MSHIVIDPLWKQAAAEESVDYKAVAKLFHDQAYSFVANKAPSLFADPFRLGFEVVHRNEKATRMFGIFAFRVRDKLIYIPVFFVHGEIKPVDMFYQTDVKQFRYLSEEIVASLTNGPNEVSGDLADRSGHRQQDMHFQRLRNPQQVKYAGWSEAEAKEAAAEMLRHAASDPEPARLLLPDLIKQAGAPVLDALADMADNPVVADFLNEHYTADQLMPADMAKQASEPDPVYGVWVINDINQIKEASARAFVADRGYYLSDNRPAGELNVATEEIGTAETDEIRGFGPVTMLGRDGRSHPGYAFDDNDYLFWSAEDRQAEIGSPDAGYRGLGAQCHERRIWLSDKKQTVPVDRLFGQEREDFEGDGPEAGRFYIFVGGDGMASAPVLIEELDGDRLRLRRSCRQSEDYWRAPETDLAHRLLGPDILMLEVRGVDRTHYTDGQDAEVPVALDDTPEADADCPRPMGAREYDRWLRTAGDLVKESAVSLRIERDSNDGLTVLSRGADGRWVRELDNASRVKAALHLCGRHLVGAGQAEELIDRRSGTVWPMAKRAYVTRMTDEPRWIETTDPRLGVTLDFPQQRELSTHTPERSKQRGHYGDHYDHDRHENPVEADTRLPRQAVMTLPPEQLAHMARQQGLTEIFDHQATSQLAESTHTVPDQIKDYIPDMEKGIDRYCRVLFLLRYRPSEVEEIYGRDAVNEMENDFQNLLQAAGECLHKTNERFENPPEE